MKVIYKLYMNERQADVQFPKLFRDFKKEIVEQDVVNPDKALTKWRMSNVEENVRYVIGVVK